jgi:hypothetical protein
MTTIIPVYQRDVAETWRIVSNPTYEHITLADAYLHLRLTPYGSPLIHPEDAWLTGFGIPAARLYCEGWMERSISLQTIEFTLGRYPDAPSLGQASYVELPMGPLVSVESAVNEDGDVTEYEISSTDPAMLHLTVSETARLRYVAGYSLAGSSPMLTPELPAAIKVAMLLMLGSLHEYREAIVVPKASVTPHELPLGVKALLQPYRLRKSMA